METKTIEAQSDVSTPTDEAAAAIVLAPGLVSWSRYVPGPSPTYRFQGLSPRASRAGVLICGCACLMLSGINVALMGSVSSTPSYLRRVGLDDGSSHTQLLIGVVNAIYWVGVMVGALLIGPVSDRIGRRRAIVCAGLYGIAVIPVFASLQTFAWAIVLRFLNGLATGSFDSVGLNWCAEAAVPRHRGRAIGLQMASAALGASQAYFLIYGIGKGVSRAGHPASEVVWRFPMAYQCVFVLFVMTAVWFLPESPRWLVRVGLDDEAFKVLVASHGDASQKEGGGSSVAAEAAAVQVRTIRRNLEEELANNAAKSYFSMLFVGDDYKTARRTWSALFVQFATQAMVGVGVVSGYGISIFQSGGWSADTAALIAGFSILTQSIFGLPGAMYADKIGRRRAFLCGSIGGSVLLAFTGMCGHFVAANADANPSKAKASGSAVVALIMIWCALFGLTWLWAPFAYPSEIFPARTRAKGSSIGIVGLALGSFFTNMISPYLFSAIGYKAMFLFSGLSFAVFIICYLWMPETANRSLEDIDHLYDKEP